MDQTPRTEERTVTCSRCGQPIRLGQGRYNVLPDEAYCSFECLRQSLPHIAEAIELFAREPRQVHSSAAAAPRSAAPRKIEADRRAGATAE